MKIYLISADGYGAGKSTLAKKLGDEVWSIAGALREDLSRQYPQYKWFSKDQEYKETTKIHGYHNNRMSMRDVLVEYGQKECARDPLVWVRKLADRLAQSATIASGSKIFVVDDVRKLCELEYLRAKFGPLVTHFHIVSTTATPEPHFENDELRQKADYRVQWEK